MTMLTGYLPRLYCKGRVLGHKRAKHNTRPNTSLIQIEGVATKEDAQFYLGKVKNQMLVLLTISNVHAREWHSCIEQKGPSLGQKFASFGGASREIITVFSTSYSFIVGSLDLMDLRAS